MTRTPPLLDLPARTAARVVCLGLLAHASAAAERVRERRDPEALHDFRVALRRLRSAIRAFLPALHDTLGRRDRDRLRDLLRDTSLSRDAEVQISWVERLLADDPDARAACEALLCDLAGERKAEAAKLGRIVRRRFPALARQLEKRFSAYTVRIDPAAVPSADGAGVALAAALARAAGELRGWLEPLDPSAPGERLHRARIASKRLRYLLEPFASELPGAAELVGSLRELQTLLGDLHDLDLLSASIVARGGDVAEDEALHRLSRRLHMRREESARALATRWLPGEAPTLLARVDELVGRLRGAGDEVEIERKFLLRGLPELPQGTEEVEVEQGWFGERFPERVRRVSGAEGERCYRAIKHGAGMRRLELEERIPAELFAALWPLTEGRRVRKRRYKVRDGDLLWEIDRFTDRELVLAEVELPDPGHPVVLPPWLESHVIREVTEEPGYLNVNLAR